MVLVILPSNARSMALQYLFRRLNCGRALWCYRNVVRSTLALLPFDRSSYRLQARVHILVPMVCGRKYLKAAHLHGACPLILVRCAAQSRWKRLQRRVVPNHPSKRRGGVWIFVNRFGHRVRNKNRWSQSCWQTISPPSRLRDLYRWPMIDPIIQALSKSSDKGRTICFCTLSDGCQVPQAKTGSICF